MSYVDKHIDYTELEADMTPTEKKAFDLGYMAAIDSLLAEINSTQQRIGNTMLDELGNMTTKRRLELQSRLHILDVYAEHYTQRLESLSKEF